MNKKVMALAVAGAFAAPAAAFAQASNVQIFGTIYMEYAYAKQGPLGAGAATGQQPAGSLNGGDMVNVDILQSPGSASRPGSSARIPRTYAPAARRVSAPATARSASKVRSVMCMPVTGTCR